MHKGTKVTIVMGDIMKVKIQLNIGIFLFPHFATLVAAFSDTDARIRKNSV